MSDVKFARGVEQIGKGALADKRAGRQWRHELLCRFGHDDADGDVALLQPPHKIQRETVDPLLAAVEQHLAAQPDQ